MKVIINADDFGYSKTRNNAIVELHKKGVLSSTTMLAVGQSFDHAVQLANEYPTLGIGVHLCLDSFLLGKDYKTLTRIDGTPYLKDEISNRLKNMGVIINEIFHEYCLQIEKIGDAIGFNRITHLDHHHHLHLYVPSMVAITRAARKYHIKSVRTPIIIASKPKSIFNKLLRFANHSYLGIFVSTVDAYFESGLKTKENFELEYKRLSKTLGLRYKSVEIVLHPCTIDDVESEFYSTDRVKDLIRKHELINYSQVH